MEAIDGILPPKLPRLRRMIRCLFFELSCVVLPCHYTLYPEMRGGREQKQFSIIGVGFITSYHNLHAF